MSKSQKQAVLAQEEEQVFSIRDFVTLCLRKWPWFLCSLIIFVSIGYLKVLCTPPTYQRSLQVLIQDEQGSGGNSMLSNFNMNDIFGANKNVYNELISLTSPAVVSEVVKRLNLQMNYSKEGPLHSTVLYRSNNPVNVEFMDFTMTSSGGFTMDLQPDQTVRLYDFWRSTPDGREELEGDLKSRLSFNMIKTPLGRVAVRPNGEFRGTLDEKITIKVDCMSAATATENYAEIVQGDLTNQDAEVIELTIDDQSVERATDILNMTVEVYNEFWVRDKNRLALATADFISDRLESLQQELNHVDDNISDFKSRNRIPDVQLAVTATMNESGEVNKSVIEARNQLAMAEYLRTYMKNPVNTNSLIPVNIGLNNMPVSDAVKEYNLTLLARQNLVANSGENNPLVRDYDARLEKQKESILSALNASIGSLEVNMRGFEGSKSENEKILSDAPSQAKYLLSIEREQKVKEELYVFLLQRREENELSQTFTAYNTRVITPPYGSQLPISPRRNMILALCVILGLTVPGVFLYVKESSNTKIRSRKDIENLSVPYLGEIPLLKQSGNLSGLLKSRKTRQAEKEAPRPVVEAGKRDVPNEAFRVVRQNIDSMIGKSNEGSVLILTSFNPGSGKSFIAYNLGASFALKGKKVLLVDGDLRHGSLSMYAGSPKKGLSDYLAGRNTNWESTIVKNVSANGLDILPIGHKPPNPAELLENGSLGTLISEARTHYDVILIDCPPVNIVVDTQLIGEYADRTIFVVRAGLLERKAVADIAGLYEEKKLRNMSILLNGTKTGYSSYYHYGNYSAYAAE
ncbi:MAG: polysaccharide biosynthesis tyrosine autokinase [Muribaculum sp.]|nr:polysaccharide biosynthesis tyrosine autokinase [Muribaculum sp.]